MRTLLTQNRRKSCVIASYDHVHSAIGGAPASRNLSSYRLLYMILAEICMHIYPDTFWPRLFGPMKMDHERSHSCRQSDKTDSVRVKCGRGVTVNHISGAPCWAGRARCADSAHCPALIPSSEEDKHLDRFPQIGAPLPKVPEIHCLQRRPQNFVVRVWDQLQEQPAQLKEGQGHEFIGAYG